MILTSIKGEGVMVAAKKKLSRTRVTQMKAAHHEIKKHLTELKEKEAQNRYLEEFYGLEMEKIQQVVGYYMPLLGYS